MSIAYDTPDPDGGFVLLFSPIGSPSPSTWPLSPPGHSYRSLSLVLPLPLAPDLPLLRGTCSVYFKELSS